jgi:hypothetical protein
MLSVQRVEMCLHSLLTIYYYYYYYYYFQYNSSLINLLVKSKYVHAVNVNNTSKFIKYGLSSAVKEPEELS